MDQPLTSRRGLLAASVLAPLLAAAGCSRQDAANGAPAATVGDFHGVDITGAEYATKLDLPDAEGRPRSLADFKGKVTVVFFGYTHCPDVCPATMAELAEVKRSLGADGARVQGVFVTLDPERDTPELLRQYVQGFDGGFVALRPTPEQLKALAKDFKVFYMKVPGKGEGSYTLDHTAGSYVYDTQGRVRLFARYGAGAQALADDLKKLLAEAPAA